MSAEGMGSEAVRGMGVPRWGLRGCPHVPQDEGELRGTG